MAQIEQFLQLIRHIWRDSRVPLLARIYLVLAPLYWINPFDFIPDLQPTGGALALLITRGGQYQLYASEDALAHMLTENSQCLFHTPPQLAGGVFITQLLSEEDSCVAKS